jgi:hypothetical protein
VAESHPIAHPPKTRSTTFLWWLLEENTTAINSTAQTMAHVMLYAV